MHSIDFLHTASALPRTLRVHTGEMVFRLDPLHSAISLSHCIHSIGQLSRRYTSGVKLLVRAMAPSSPDMTLSRSGVGRNLACPSPRLVLPPSPPPPTCPGTTARPRSRHNPSP